MKTLEKGQDKIKKICHTLREETLEPARMEAEKILAAAQEQAKEIVERAEEEAGALHERARKQIEQERTVFEYALKQAAKQSIESLKQEIENHLFNPELEAFINKKTADPHVMARVIDAIVQALKKEGIKGNLAAYVAQAVSPEEVNRLLTEDILQQLSKGTVELGDFEGGAAVYVKDKRMTLDITDRALKELLAQYIRKDLREKFFVD